LIHLAKLIRILCNMFEQTRRFDVDRRHFALSLSAATIGGLAMTQSRAESATQFHGKYEIPPYAVERKEGDFEVRRYAPHLVAAVTVDGSRSRAANQGFRILAGYIFGGNEAGQSISMTAPVVQAPQTDDTWEVTFMMPSRFTKESLPSTADTRIRFFETAPERQAVLRFSGRWRGVFEPQTKRLRDWMSARDLTPASDPRFYFYDDPFTMPWRRRNEIAFVLA